ncbi:hypothetical protein EST38_g10485 [Candolleomyces aberdarensis]|uniref:Uncharacterized protein n=1 Tax=Candolleomyces aberdarensis TaxID=2316362 RepID=A0A4Q2D792_9AGAR|nr:hypothetical protein EST38_g10485 [Candolleomyces aberdarensis]
MAIHRISNLGALILIHGNRFPFHVIMVPVLEAEIRIGTALIVIIHIERYVEKHVRTWF